MKSTLILWNKTRCKARLGRIYTELSGKQEATDYLCRWSLRGKEKGYKRIGGQTLQEQRKPLKPSYLNGFSPPDFKPICYIMDSSFQRLA